LTASPAFRYLHPEPNKSLHQSARRSYGENNMIFRQTSIASLAFTLAAVLAFTILVPTAKADNVQVGTLVADSSLCGVTGARYYCGDVYLADNMSDATLSAIEEGPFNDPLTVSPGDTDHYFQWTGAYDSSGPGIPDFVVSGVIGSIDFTVGGIAYEATSPAWTIEWLGNFDGDLPIYVSATSQSSTTNPMPEPGTFLLLFLGVAFVMLMAPKSRNKVALQ
jgi:hypothetical protein